MILIYMNDLQLLGILISILHTDMNSKIMETCYIFIGFQMCMELQMKIRFSKK